MKKYFLCRCDFGDSWKVSKNDFNQFFDSEKICPNGHEIITATKYEYIDDVIIKFLPAGVIRENSNNDPINRGHYYLSISNHDQSVEKTSIKPYSWKEVIGLAQRFDKRSFEEGLKFWELWKL